jgi:4-hydroxybenzoyl-CoA reductase subunit beta
MRLHAFTTFQPKTLKEVLSLKGKYRQNALVKAGGTSLMPEMGLGLKKPQYLILLDGIEEIRGIEEKTDGLHIGAMTSLEEIKKTTMVKNLYGPLAEAVESVSAPSMHYQSTLGGNICQDTRCIYYDQSEFWRQAKGLCFKQGGDRCHAAPGAKGCHSVYQGDLAPILICLDAEISIVSAKKTKNIKLAELFSGNGIAPLRLPANSLITEIIIPPMGGKKAVYEKLSERGALDYPLAGVAVFVKMRDGLVEEHAFVATAIGPAPLVVSDPLLNGRGLDEEFISRAAQDVFKKARPVANTTSAPSYRRQMVKTLVEKALRRLS